MRLEKIVLNKIKEAINDSFGDVNIYLFGSRVNDAKKGGDIDIDIVNLNTKDELLKKQIEKDGILI
jgi:predicted nucleotidyltransferase